MSSAPVPGALSNSASCWSSWLSGGYKKTGESADPHLSFVEDRTYKLIIVDSIMNLFRASVTLERT